ncbi:MAG: TIGR04211 family SH3 domain-containing protein [Desulfovibrionaceae bacterium]|nr:TIGR04211 family SH3 domain-containing protein [Desulfovibrionaceae bacterium]
MSTCLLSLRKNLPLIFILFLTVFCFCSTAAAETRYIVDVLIVDVRDSMGSKYNKIATVKTGEAVEVLEETKRFVKVRTRKGDVGYISKQYVDSNLPKKVVIGNLQSEVKRLKKKVMNLQADKDGFNDKIQVIKAQNQSYQQEISGVTIELKRAVKEIESFTVKNQGLNDKLAVLDQITQEKDELKAKIKKLEPRISILQERYDQALLNNKEAAELITERDEVQDQLMAVQADMEFLKEKHQKLIDESQEVVSIINERDTLSSEAQKNAKEMTQLRDRNDELEGTQMVYWFLAGAGVLLIGMLIGKSSARKKRSMLS